MIIQLFSFGLTVLANVLLGSVVFFRNPKSKTNQKFAFMTLAIILWITTLFLYYTVSSSPILLWVGRTNVASAVFIPFATFIFISYFSNRLLTIPKWINIGVYALTLLFSLLSFTPFIDANEIARGFSRTVVFGPLYLAY